MPTHTCTPPLYTTRLRAQVDFQRRLSLHPNIVPFIGACEPAIEDASAPLPGSSSQHTSLDHGQLGVSGASPSPEQLAIVMGCVAVRASACARALRRVWSVRAARRES